jgi:hypothetical protein
MCYAALGMGQQSSTGVPPTMALDDADDALRDPAKKKGAAENILSGDEGTLQRLGDREFVRKNREAEESVKINKARHEMLDAALKEFEKKKRRELGMGMEGVRG